jgi:general secretion pathway protein G
MAIFVSAKQRGATLLEFAVAAMVLGVLIGILLNRIQFYQGEAERAAVANTVASLRTALEFKVTEARWVDRSANFRVFAEQNPFDWLKNKPANYAGELYNPTDEDIGKGNWCFDRSTKTLVYLLNNRNSVDDARSQHLKFKVKLTRLPHSPAKPSGTPETVSVAFEQVKD